MAQFYFLSILFNTLAGLILVYGANLALKEEGEALQKNAVRKTSRRPAKKQDEEEKEESNRLLFKNYTGFDNKNLRIIVGVLSIFTGIMKLLSVFRNDVPVIGDLLPSVAGLAGGVSILMEYYIGTSTETVVLPGAVQKIFIDSRKYLGLLCFLAALLHFVFPQVMLL